MNKWFTDKLIYKILRLTIGQLLLMILTMSISFAWRSNAQVLDKVVSVHLEQKTLKDALVTLEHQTNVKFVYSASALSMNDKINVIVSGEKLGYVLNLLLEPLNIQYVVKGKNYIVLKKFLGPSGSKKIKYLDKMGSITAEVVEIKGKVTGSENEPIAGVNVLIKGTSQGTVTDVGGNYTIGAKKGDILSFSFIGFKPVEIEVGKNTTIDVTLEEDLSTLDEVVILSTGYQEIPKERATGSFVHVDNDIITRTPGTNVLDRLDGIVPGLLFDKRDPDNPRLQIRGFYTLNADAEPLIVIDNFPYEGDINSINPNDIQDITILKDAAATSIWGARAGNGVIVITTKKGKFNQKPQLSFTSSVVITEKPDLFDLPLLSSSEGIEIEQYLFEQGYYDSRITSASTPITPAVQILAGQRDGDLTETEAKAQLDALGNRDVRNDYLKYVFQPAVLQTYAATFSTGSENTSMLFSAGYDKNLGSSIGDETDRVSLRLQNGYKPIENLNIQVGINYTRENNEINGKEFGTEDLYRSPIPMYTRLADDQGNPMVVERDYRSSYTDTLAGGELLDWKYRPFDEIRNGDETSIKSAVLANLNITYDITKAISARINYQYENTAVKTQNIHNTETYFTRNLINIFTNTSATSPTERHPIPVGDIREFRDRHIEGHSARGQININKEWNGKHQIVALAGGEMREVINNISQQTSYGYHKQRLTIGQVDEFTRWPTVFGSSAYIYWYGPSTLPDFAKHTDRYVSVFANASYTYKKRYTVSGSARNDYSNIFGVDTNEKGSPFWSAGASWNISAEPFYNISFLPYLKFRTTYGFNGNIDPSVSALTIVGFLNPDYRTGLAQARINKIPNPQLRWEKIGQWNLGLDFSLFEDERISGSIEYYKKESTNVIALQTLDPTVGGLRQVQNSMNMEGNGIDIILHTKNITNPQWHWTSDISFSSAKFKVTKQKLLSLNDGLVSDGTLGGGSSTRFVREGENPFELISYPWGGLDPDTGDPRTVLNGETVHYDSVNVLKGSDLVHHGSAVPVYFGNLLNNISYKGFTLSANITYRLGYYFRRPSVSYDNLVENYGVGHTDYKDRWQEPGDEQFTDVPSFIYPIPSSYRRNLFASSEKRVEKGDHIRLEDIRLSYTFPTENLGKFPFKHINVYAILGNLNMLIWKANDRDIDPEFPGGMKSARRITFGLNAKF